MITLIIILVLLFGYACFKEDERKSIENIEREDRLFRIRQELKAEQEAEERREAAEAARQLSREFHELIGRATETHKQAEHAVAQMKGTLAIANTKRGESEVSKWQREHYSNN